MSIAWDDQLARLLNELSEAQAELLELLNEKRALLLASDPVGLSALVPREESLIARLQACHDQRASLLEQASDEGLPSDSIRALASALPRAQRDKLGSTLRDTSAQARLLKHKSLTNWVVVQRTLIHLSQLLEIIATGGRVRPTYQTGPAQFQEASGALVDQAA